MNPPGPSSDSSDSPSFGPSIRKTQRKMPDLNSEANSYSFLEKEGPSTIEDTQEYQNTRANHIHNMLNKMNFVRVENDGSPLENFSAISSNPPENIRFSPSTGEESSEDKSFSKSSTSDKIGNASRQYMQNPNPIFIQPYSSNENPLSPSTSLGNSISSYKDSYVTKKGTGSGSSLTEGLNSMGLNKITEKMNYVIYLLEQQQHEETHHITEEFILYIFLGVFVIYIVDSFSRSGKYIR
jgi:hypothetical protein